MLIPRGIQWADVHLPSDAVVSQAERSEGQRAGTGMACTGVSAMPSSYCILSGEDNTTRSTYPAILI